MKRLSDFLFVRHRHNWALLLRFGLVGGSGVLVNLVTLVIVRKLGAHPEAVFFDLPLTDFNIRWYHVFSTIAFVVANLWNFQLNRTWTFKSGKHANWFSEYGPFLLVGAIGQAIGLIIITFLMHPSSPIGLPSAVFDDSTGFRTKVYWAQLIQIAIITPLSFLLNKLWTFRAVRVKEADVPGAAQPAVAEIDDDLGGHPHLEQGPQEPAPGVKVPDAGRDVG